MSNIVARIIRKYSVARERLLLPRNQVGMVWHARGVVGKAMWLVHGKNCPRMLHSQKLGTHFEELLIFILR